MGAADMVLIVIRINSNFLFSIFVSLKSKFLKSKSKSNNNKNNNMEGTRPLTGPALTYDLCSQNVKVNVNVKTALILTLKY